MDIRIVNKSENPNPMYATEGSAACDLQANLPMRPIDFYDWHEKGDGVEIKEDADSKHDVIEILPNGRAKIPTGIFIEVTPGFHATIKSRSGNSLKLGLMVLNGTGTIDCDYRGEVCVVLYNSDNRNTISITHGMKIAQLAIAKTNKIVWVNGKLLNSTARGNGGFGHSDKVNGTKLVNSPQSSQPTITEAKAVEVQIVK